MSIPKIPFKTSNLSVSSSTITFPFLSFFLLKPMGPAVLSSHTNGFSQSVDRNFEEKTNYINDDNSSHESVINNVNGDDCHWYEEIIDENLKWSFALNRYLIFLISFRNLLIFSSQISSWIFI